MTVMRSARSPRRPTCRALLLPKTPVIVRSMEPKKPPNSSPKMSHIRSKNDIAVDASCVERKPKPALKLCLPARWVNADSLMVAVGGGKSGLGNFGDRDGREGSNRSVFHASVRIVPFPGPEISTCPASGPDETVAAWIVLIISECYSHPGESTPSEERAIALKPPLADA